MAAMKVSSKAQKALVVLEEGRRKAQRLYSLIEQYCNTTKNQDSMAQSIARTATDVSRVFMNAGLGAMADNARGIAQGIRRGGHTQGKYRQMRELIGSLNAGIDRQEKVVMDADRELKREESAP